MTSPLIMNYPQFCACIVLQQIQSTTRGWCAWELCEMLLPCHKNNARTQVQLYDKHLKKVFETEIAATERKINSERTSITVNELPDVLGVLAVNILFTYFDTESTEKVVHLDVSQVSACNSVALSKVLSPVLERYGKPWRDTAAISSSSAEYIRKALYQCYTHVCLSNGNCEVQIFFSKLQYVHRPERSSLNSKTFKMSAMMFVSIAVNTE